LRDFIKRVDDLGAWRRIDGGDQRFELGGISEVAAGSPQCPALLFDRIEGFPKGFRVFTNATTSPQRAALALGIDPMLKPLEALKEWMRKRQTLVPQRPVEVASAPFLANSMRGRGVDLAKLPAPYWHKKDGGPFIGSLAQKTGRSGKKIT
jgi:4-hydroxy-3-polyprenylbenzoate decarboxylase